MVREEVHTITADQGEAMRRHVRDGSREQRDLGRAGEEHAAQYYHRRGAEVIGRNVNFPVGELDLVVREPDGTVVFAEIKTRSTLDFGGAESVTPGKRRRLRAAATRWLSAHRDLGWVPVRFDVLLLVPAGPGTAGEFTVEHWEGIFDGTR